MSEPQNSVEVDNTCLVLTEQKLYQFSKSHLAQFSLQELKNSSTGATLICAFLMGATKTFASDNEALQLTIAERLGLDDRGTSHLIDTTRRLSQKYPFVSHTLKQGEQAAAAWQSGDGDTDAMALGQLLHKCRNLTLLELKKLGVKEEVPAPATPREAVHQAVETNPRLKRLLFILLALIIFVSANYIVLALF